MVEVSRELLLELNLFTNEENREWTYEIDGDTLKIIYNVSSVFSGNWFCINIYRLSDKAIDWIESQGFWIKKEYKEIYALMKGTDEVYGIDTKKRIDIPFMCMQWILDNKN